MPRPPAPPLSHSGRCRACGTTTSANAASRRYSVALRSVTAAGRTRLVIAVPDRARAFPNSAAAGRHRSTLAPAVPLGAGGRTARSPLRRQTAGGDDRARTGRRPPAALFGNARALSGTAMTRRVRPAAVTLRSATLYRLLAALALVVGPHALHLPLWLSGVAVGLGIWRYIAARRQLRLPPTWLRIALTVLAHGAIFGQYGTLLGRDAGAALLIAMLGLKLLELREPRDVYVVACLGYFLVIVHFLYSQTPLLVVYMLATVVLLTATLIDLNRREHAPLRPLLRLAATLVGYAVPLMLAAFILFPRISGPLWGLPNDAYSGMSGLSNEMAPGRISQLSLSDAVAFRVEFEGALPPPQQRYWRGPVFSLTDGERWRGGPLGEGERGAPSFVALGAPFRYSVTLEPHDHRWLFALDLPAELPAGARATDEFQLYAPQAVRERQRYTLTSYPDYRTVDMCNDERRRTLQLPAEGSPRARALAADWRAHATSSADVVQAALRMYREQHFVYTLTPPRIDDDFVDGFLFGTRRGFCEHYAASFAFLMRAAGIPARVVTGYQGGELNSIGNYLVVRQRDAHAWTEVWLGDSGWGVSTRTQPLSRPSASNAASTPLCNARPSQA